MIKRITTLVFVFLTIVGNAVWGQETVQISTVEDLYAFAERVDEGETSLNAILMNSIVINENVLSEDGHLNISNPDRWKFDRLTYSGTFDGQGNTISGFYSSNPFLGTLKEGGVIKNLGIIDSYFYMANGYSCAIFCTTNEGTISNCWNSGTLDIGVNTNPASLRGSRIGIFCETNEGTIEGCHNEGYIYSAAEFYEGIRSIGGICGMNSGIIRKCYNAGKINITAEDSGVKYPTVYYIGGIAGNVEGNSEGDYKIISECYNAGEIIVHGGDTDNWKNRAYILIGGIIGRDYTEDMFDIIPAKISSCYNIGTCTVNDLKCDKDIAYSVGGITGASASPTKDCYSVGNISGNDKSATFILLGNLFSTNIFGGYTTLENLSYTNCYYEKKVDNIGYYTDAELLTSGNPFVPITELEGAIEKGNDAFQSGEVAWLLHKGGYGQRIGTDAHPVLINLGNEGTEVYKLVLSSEEVEADTYPTYVNNETEITPFEDLALEEGKTIGWYKGDDLVATGLTYIVNSADADEDATITLTAKIIDEPEEEPEQPGDDDDQDDNQGSDIHKPQRPIKYYNIYVDTICPGLNVEVSKDVVQEGHQVSAYLTIQAECDTTGMRFEYKRGLFGYWKDLKELEGVQPGEYIIKNIYTDIYIRALDATLPEEEPTGIEDVEGVKAYTKEGSIYVYTPSREEVTIIGMSGAIIKHEEQVGLQSYSVSRGIYIVRIGEKVFKLKN